MSTTIKMVYAEGTTRKELGDDINPCLYYIESEYGISSYAGEEARIIGNAMERIECGYTWQLGDDTFKIVIVSDYPGAQPIAERSADDYIEWGIDEDDVDELILARPSMLTAERIVDLLDGYDSITIASSRVTLHADAPAEDVHRIIAAVKNTQTTIEGDEILQQQWGGGRPPLGTETSKGRLVKGEDFEQIRSVLQNVVFGEKSKSRAAREIGCARKTVGNTLRDRAELYDLPRQ